MIGKEPGKYLPGTGRGTATRSGVVEGPRRWRVTQPANPSTAFGGPPPRSGEA